MNSSPLRIQLTLEDHFIAAALHHVITQISDCIITDKQSNVCITDSLQHAPENLPVLLIVAQDSPVPTGMHVLALPCRYTTLINAMQQCIISKAPMALTKDWQLSTSGRQLIHLSGHTYPLTESETALLAQLISYKGKSVTSGELRETILGYHEEATSHALESHIYRLRGKLREILPDHELIETTKTGYRLA